MKSLKNRFWRIAAVVALLSAFVSQPAWRSAASPSVLGWQNEIVVEDIFGRTLNQRGIALVDWDGYLANPKITFFVRPPANVQFPATAVLTANHQRLYFDLPSEAGAAGPRKTISFASSTTRIQAGISIFPDRDSSDEDHTLTIQLTDAGGVTQSATINLHVFDQDRNQPAPFTVTVDFSKDRTGFFDDQQKRDIIRQSAADWAYFIDEMNLASVPAGAETTFIWNPDGFVTGSFTTNSSAYKGFLLYVYGIHHAQLRSGGEASNAGGFQSGNGAQLQLRRSGGVEVETNGNYNTLGWFLAAGDNDWWRTGNANNEQNDLYSIVHHEMGHALFFNPAYPVFQQSKTVGSLADAALAAYHGANPAIDGSDHFSGSVDAVSRRGAFGNEYFGDVPRRRWLITKFDLLAAQAIGYKIRQTFTLAAPSPVLPAGQLSAAYSVALQARGGIPPYNWTIESGALPGGLTLNTETGVIAGRPNAAGAFNFTLRLRDSSEAGASVAAPLSILIAPRTAANVSAASYSGAELASESIVAAFGNSLATTTQIASTVPLPTQLAGTTVRVRDGAGVERLAPLFFVAPTQINYQIPPGTAAGNATIAITSGDGSVSTGSSLIAGIAPGLFSANSSGQGVAAAVALRIKASGAQSYEPVAVFDAAQSRFVATPIDLGPASDQVFLILYGTGLRLNGGLSNVTAVLGGTSAEVFYAGAQNDFVGLDQANLQIPRSLIGRGEIEVAMTVGGKAANPLRINVR